MKLVVMVAMLTAISIHHANSAAPTVEALVSANDLVSRVPGTTSQITMVLRDEGGATRVRRLRMFTKLQVDGHDNARRLDFLAPGDIKGTKTLLIEHSGSDDDMWIYLPALKKTRRLVTKNKRDSFVGSDLTFGDLIGHPPKDWKPTSVLETAQAGADVYQVTVVPVSDEIKEHTGYSKRILWIDKTTKVALRTDYWDEDGHLLKSITVDHITSAGAQDKWQFLHVQAKNVQTGHSTELTFDQYDPKPSPDTELFLSRALSAAE